MKLSEAAYIMKTLLIQLFLYFTQKGKCVLMKIALVKRLQNNCNNKDSIKNYTFKIRKLGFYIPFYICFVKILSYQQLHIYFRNIF